MREDDDDVNKENILGVDSCKNKSRSLLDTLRGVTARNNVLILQLWVELVEEGRRKRETHTHSAAWGKLHSFHLRWDGGSSDFIIAAFIKHWKNYLNCWFSNQATLWSASSKLAALSAFLARLAQVSVDMRQTTTTMSVSTFCSDICSDIRSGVLKQSEPFGRLPTVLLDCSAFSCIHCVSILLWKLIFGHKCLI